MESGTEAAANCSNIRYAAHIPISSLASHINQVMYSWSLQISHPTFMFADTRFPEVNKTKSLHKAFHDPYTQRNGADVDYVIPTE